jgi:antitoxin component of RelBE/YafQ-DinJ toxin-antitoxin module
MAEAKQKRAMLNTTINENVLNNFRDYCKGINCPMNMVLETFMEQFANGQFSFKLIKNKMEIDIES